MFCPFQWSFSTRFHCSILNLSLFECSGCKDTFFGVFLLYIQDINIISNIFTVNLEFYKIRNTKSYTYFTYLKEKQRRYDGNYIWMQYKEISVISSNVYVFTLICLIPSKSPWLSLYSLSCVPFQTEITLLCFNKLI